MNNTVKPTVLCVFGIVLSEHLQKACIRSMPSSSDLVPRAGGWGAGSMWLREGVWGGLAGRRDQEASGQLVAGRWVLVPALC